MADPRLEPSPGETGSALVHLEPSQVWPPAPVIADGLSNPADDEIAPSLAGLLPVGFAWRTPDGGAFDWDSMMGAFLRALSSGLATLYRLIYGLTLESTAATIVNGLTDWEEEYGLPDACLGFDPSRETRFRFLLAKVRSTGTITPADFIDLAAFLGFTITIREPMPFRAGVSRCGAGAERVAGAIRIDYIWIVKPTAAEIIPFRAGKGRAGVTPLGEIVRNERLECLFNKLKPAWTKVVFDYSGV